jgi:phage/plasmid-associated DNA primase
MSQINNDPIQQLEDTKKAIKTDIAIVKQKKSDANRERNKISKLELELHPDKKTRLDAKEAEITVLTKQLIELEQDLKNLNGTESDREDEQIQAALLRVEQEWINEQNSAVYLTQDKTFLFIQDYSESRLTQNVQIREYADHNFHEFLANELKLALWHLPVPRVKKLFMDKNRAYDIMRYSLKNHRWRRDRVFLPLNHLREYFIDRFELTEEEKQTAYSAFFDVLMHSLSGGKLENREHIERWLVHKIKNYHKVATTPDMVIVGQVGGNGKGLIQMIMRLLFPAQLVGKANSKTLNGNFNAIMVGKLVVFFDDQSSKEIDLDIVKQLAGSETMIVEPKGKDQYETETTHNSAWFSNQLPFKLTPEGQEGGVDRRFSIMRTNITFLESIIEHYAKQDLLVNMMEAKDIAERVVSDVLLNRVEVAKWFGALCERYPEIDENYTLKPLHGEDYHYFLNRQQDNIDLIFNQLVRPLIKADKIVPIFVIKELLRHLDGKVVGDKTIVTKIRELADKNRLDIEQDRKRIKIHPNKFDMTKQCAIFKPKDMKSQNYDFDWSLVSSEPYSPTMLDERYIQEDQLVFGNKSMIIQENHEEIEEIFNFDDEE